MIVISTLVKVQDLKLSFNLVFRTIIIAQCDHAGIKVWKKDLPTLCNFKEQLIRFGFARY